MAESSSRFKDKVVIVTGGCTGIGKGCVDVFLDNGAKVVIFDIDEQAGTALSTERPDDVYYVKCDVSKEDEVKSSVESTVDKFGKLDCLINNAGFYTSSGAVDQMKLADFHKIMDVNLFGYFLMIKYSVPHLRKTKGSILNIASIAGSIGYQSSIAYSATKCFTGNDLDSTEKYYETLNDKDVINKAQKMCLLNRYGKTREVGEACLYLASEGTYCTGMDLPITAGIDVGLGMRSTNVIE